MKGDMEGGRREGGGRDLCVRVIVQLLCDVGACCQHQVAVSWLLLVAVGCCCLVTHCLADKLHTVCALHVLLCHILFAQVVLW